MTKSRFRADGDQSRVSETSLDAFRLVRTGKTYDLSSGWWPGMPILPAHPPFQLMTYRSPPGVRNQRDLGFLVEDNQVNLSFVSEMLMCTTHSGTHIDALAHITCGPENCWHGGFSANTHLGDFGPLNKDASELPPLIKRGVMIDVPGALGVPHLAPHQAIHRAELQQALARQGCEVKTDDVVLVRTGMMMDWPDAQRMEASAGAGLDLDGAEWLVERGVCAVGGDTVALEVVPSGRPGDPQPVHRYLIQEQGVLIMEWVFMEDLARDGVYEFLFICLPLSIKGATGSLIRPLAIG